MEAMQWLTLIVFALTIVVVITNVIDGTLAALIGVAVMCWMGIMTETEAFKFVDWNVMAILVGIWIIAGHFGKSGVPSWLSIQALKLSGGRPGLLVMILTFLAGVISMFVDNVVTILMMAPVALPLARAMKLSPVPVILMIGFGANFMGTALLIGDLPPHLAALMQTNINVQSLTVEAVLTGNRDHVYHAAMLDPHTAAELTLDEIWSLVDELLEAHGEMIPPSLRGSTG